MGNLDIVVPEKFAGSNTVHVAQGTSGPRDYVQGSGADMVPSKTGPGDIYIVPDNTDGAALTFTGVNEEGKQAILEVSRQIVGDDQELTHRSILQALAAKASEV